MEFQIEVHTYLDENLPVVSADRVQLQQVMLNLITNAIDAMEPVIDRERRLRVVSELKGDDSIIVTIEDSGTGFAQGDIDSISILSSPPSLTAWEWVSQYAGRSSKLIGGSFRRHRATRTEQSFGLFCRLSAMSCSEPRDMSFERQDSPGCSRSRAFSCARPPWAKRGSRARTFNYLVGAGEHRRRNSNAKRLSGLEVDRHLVFCRCLHRQVGGFLALENAIDVSSRAPVLIDWIGPVGG